MMRRLRSGRCPRWAALFACAITAGLLLSSCGSLLRLRSRRPAAVTMTTAPGGAVAAPVATGETGRVNHPYWAYAHARSVSADSAEVAEGELRRALTSDPTYAPALALLSKLYFDAGRHAEGVALLEQVRRNPEAFAPRERARLLAGLALHEQALGRDAESQAAIAMAREASVRDAAPAALYLAVSAAPKDEAAAAAAEGAARDARSAAGQNNAGIARLRSGDVAGARAAFESAIQRDPSLPGPYYNLAILEKYWGLDDAAAARRFTEYWSRSHDDPDGLVGVFSEVVAQAAPQKGDRR